MTGFVAVILVCLNATPADRCTEETAADVMSTSVTSELGCTTGWQEVVGRSALRDDIGKTAYVKTICRREVPVPPDGGRPDDSRH
ncbi:MAG TPA: hypothetical protein VMQ11_02355 [Alphaproteobacteria bacterium]|nr:hypothetical protein [Alphaproteobacteria bacterium]